MLRHEKCCTDRGRMELNWQDCRNLYSQTLYLPRSSALPPPPTIFTPELGVFGKLRPRKRRPKTSKTKTSKTKTSKTKTSKTKTSKTKTSKTKTSKTKTSKTKTSKTKTSKTKTAKMVPDIHQNFLMLIEQKYFQFLLSKPRGRHDILLLVVLYL